MDVVSVQHAAKQHTERIRALVDDALGHLVDKQEPTALYDAVRYVLAGRGKRLRPALLVLAAEAFGAEAEEAMPAALAVEVFHNFTLVHDDIMDHADERRGQPTVHVKWDRDTAILCGDFLMALSYELLARSGATILPDLMTVYSQMVAQLCEGQMLDKAFETRRDVTVDEYVHMIDCKTGALLRTVLELGGRIGGASAEQVNTLRDVGVEVGRAFQMQDDLLDLVADDARWGKTIGGDLIEGKKTMLLLEALERADGAEHAWFARIVADGGLPASDVSEARRRMEQLGVIDAVRADVEKHSARALAGLATLPASPAREALHGLVSQMQARLH